MKKVIKKVINNINKAGYEAFIVGGYVRDYLMGIESFDIDICTNAKPDTLMTIFPLATFNNIGGIAFSIKKYNFEITTYRKELQYENRKPIKIKFISDLLIDLQRRDFTINTLIMNKKGIIKDYLHGISDLQNKQIKIVGDIKTKLTEDPLRIMRAIRFASTLNFKLEDNFYHYIKKNNKLVATLSSTRLKEELDKILLSDYPIYGLSLLKELDIMNINYSNITAIKNLTGMYAQLKTNISLPFTKKEKQNINSLKEILKDKKITNYTLYSYDKEIIELAASILKLDIKYLKKRFKKLPIHSRKDIKITALEITKLLNLSYDKNISIIYKELEKNIISGKIKNIHKDIYKYLKENQHSWI